MGGRCEKRREFSPCRCVVKDERPVAYSSAGVSPSDLAITFVLPRKSL